MSIAERPRGFVRPTRKRHYNSLPKTSLEGAIGAPPGHGPLHEVGQLLGAEAHREGYPPFQRRIFQARLGPPFHVRPRAVVEDALTKPRRRGREGIPVFKPFARLGVARLRRLSGAVHSTPRSTSAPSFDPPSVASHPPPPKRVWCQGTPLSTTVVLVLRSSNTVNKGAPQVPRWFGRTTPNPRAGFSV